MNNKKVSNLNFDSILVFMISISILIFSFSNGVNGNDFWWHAKVGEWISVNHKIPTSDFFSWHTSLHGAKWYSHEWLSEYFIYQVLHHTGEIGVYLFSLLSAFLIFFILIYYNRKHLGKSLVFSCAVFLLFTAILPNFCYFRPHLFSFILLTLITLLMFHFKKHPDTKLIFLLPVISLLWVNLHGGSSNLTYIIPIIFLISTAFDLKIGKLKSNKIENSALIRLFISMAISFLALFINPHGSDMILYPYTNMMDKNMLAYITEWAAPDAKDISCIILVYFPIIAIAILFIITRKNIDMTHFFLFGFTTYLTFRSIRFIVFLVIICIFFIFEYKSPKNKSAKESKKGTDNPVIEKILLGIILLMISSLSVIGIIRTVNYYHKNNGLVQKSVDKKFINLIKKEKPQRLYNTSHLGELLIYNDIPVFIDGRADLYKGTIYNDHARLNTMQPLAFDDKETPPDYDITNKIIKKYNFDGFFVVKDMPLTTYLYSHPDKYKVLLEDKSCVYFKTIK